MSRRRKRALQLALPGALVAALMFIALWRVSGPMTTASPETGGASPAARPAPLPPLSDISDMEATAIGRRALFEGVEIREVPSARTLWIGDGDSPAFVVLDPDVKKTSAAVLQPGSRVTLIGLVRAAPAADTAIRQWALDAPTAQRAVERGVYVYVTEIR